MTIISTQDVNFANHAIGGSSSKSFITDGRVDAILGVIKLLSNPMVKNHDFSAWMIIEKRRDS